VIVRAARAEDVEAMARVHWLSAKAAYGREEDFARRLRSTRDAFELGHVRCFVADDDGELVGIANVGPDVLYALYVHPARWGDGVGQALLEQAHSALAETCDEAELTVLADNARARRFYERNGWACSEELTEPHFGGEPTRVARYRRAFGS
jgi:GNAT superfamily N-acetyltransferase